VFVFICLSDRGQYQRGGFRWVHFYIIMEVLKEKEFIRKPIILALKREKAQNFWTFSLY
jgi:hypothetical protein